jgi:protoporphyrinogen oxidase
VLEEHDHPACVLEAAPWLGGASRTVEWKDFRFDLGGHRFYTRKEDVLELVNDLLGEEILRVPRQSRILLNGQFVNYPLTFFNALKALGPLTSLAVTGSYAKEKVLNLLREPPDVTFEDWVVSRFGRRLYEIYFKTYSEKVWGVPCTEMEADFAAQRIRGLSFREAIKNMITRRSKSSDSLVGEFLYPKYGFGRICDELAAVVPQERIHTSTPVTLVHHDGQRVTGVTTEGEEGEQRLEGEEFLCTYAITDLVRALDPAPPREVVEAADRLGFRDIIVLFLGLDTEQVSEDHWIYFPDPDLFFGRVHEPKNWSPVMAPEDQTGLVVEVFCYKDEPVWEESDGRLIQRSADKLEELGLVNASDLIGGTVVRFEKAYPLYEAGYSECLETIHGFLDRLENLQLAGRNALFRYTSGDRYIEMGMKAAHNILGRGDHDLHEVATEQEYAEK